MLLLSAAIVAVATDLNPPVVARAMALAVTSGGRFWLTSRLCGRLPMPSDCCEVAPAAARPPAVGSVVVELPLGFVFVLPKLPPRLVTAGVEAARLPWRLGAGCGEEDEPRWAPPPPPPLRAC